MKRKVKFQEAVDRYGTIKYRKSEQVGVNFKVGKSVTIAEEHIINSVFDECFENEFALLES